MLKRLSLLLLVGLTFARPDFASVAQLKTQAPGYYRFMVGDIEVTALLDGFFPMKLAEVLKDPAAKKVKQLLAQSYQGDLIPTSVNAFLVNTGSKVILIDSGCGGFFGASFGNVLANLKASGYSPEQVDEIEITHMHADHLGGIAVDGKMAFPNAVIRMDKKDADYWLNADNEKTTQGQMQVMIKNAIAAVAPYQAADRVKPFQGSTDLAPGVRAISTYGHTPGHTAYAIESKGKKLLLVGDLLHIEALQFPDPSIAMKFDSSTKEAVGERKKIFKEAAAQGYLVGAAHLPFPGIGHVMSAGAGYRYLPLPYGPVQ